MSQSLTALCHMAQGESWNVCSQPKAKRAWCLAWFNSQYVPFWNWITKCVSFQQVVLQSTPVLLTVAELLQHCTWEVLNLYIYIKLLFSSFPFFYKCYRSVYYLMNTSVGTRCCVIKGWGAEGSTAWAKTGIWNRTIRQAIKILSFWSQKVQSTWTSVSVLAWVW